MRKLFVLIFVIVLLFAGCASNAQKLKKTNYCSHVKEAIADNFEIYGLFLQEAGNQQNSHYCEYYLGKTRVLQLLYTDETDPEYAYYESYNGIKFNLASKNYSIVKSKEKTQETVRSFYVESIDKSTGKIEVYAAAFNTSSSITLSAFYQIGFPNPFTDGKLLENVAVKALSMSKN